MGCGHSKINIYPRKARSKHNSTKSVAADKAETEEDEGLENDCESAENLEDCDQKRTIRVKPFGGPLVAQTEISSSQQDFFKMLDDKILNGPDYNSESDTEKAAEAARLSSLLKDWETASAGSRSLPATPKRRVKPPPPGVRADGLRSADVVSRELDRSLDRNYVSQIPQNIIHQSYGVTQLYKQPQVPYNHPNYSPASSSHQMASYPSAMQYSAISPMYSNQPPYPPPMVRQYAGYNQHGSPIKSYINTSPKHIPYEQPTVYSPSHKLYGPPVPVAVPKTPYSNGELQQPPLYTQHQIQYQQYKVAREQIITQNQPPPAPYRVVRNYQSSVTIPIMKNPPSEMNPLHRKQYELT